LDKTIKSPRNSWHSWRIPGGIGTCSKKVKDPKSFRNSWGIPGGFLEELTLVQKYLGVKANSGRYEFLCFFLSLI
jgi:hypothetical protein